MSRSRTLPPMIALAEDLSPGHRSRRPTLVLVPRRRTDGADGAENAAASPKDGERRAA